jgi:class 3 adenylate cyclase
VLGYLIDSRSRRAVTARLESLRKLYGASYSLSPLRRRALALARTSTSRQRHLLVRFLSNLARYHRDLENFNMLREAMDSVNLATKPQLINLSRANGTLHEFLLPDEIEREEKPIINHVIIKADLRGSTEVTERLKRQRLNPASHFSLHFFAPITETLAEYGAHKVFIEGDAIILAIQEQAETPEGWYGVSRACGLAIRILKIVGQHNVETEQYGLPSLELGIGVAYHDGPPTYLFDGENRIMISPAINLADRLSGCAHRLRRRVTNSGLPFNLQVWATETPTDPLGGGAETLLRYNVNGIELNAAGFRKLKAEIDLKPFLLKINGGSDVEKIRIYTGKFPTVSGQPQRLVIREGRIPVVSLPDFSPQRFTDRTYYEVCTHPKLYATVDRMISRQGKTQKTAPLSPE